MEKASSSQFQAVLISGASTGIGRDCALRLDARGFQVFATVRNESDAESLKKASSERMQAVFLDLNDQASIVQAEKTVATKLGNRGLAGLVNNAGIAVPAPLEFIPLEDLRRQLEINLIGQVAVTQVFLHHLRRARGRVINMSSFSGQLALPFFGPYAASKFALEAISDALRVELRPWGIQVIVIEPGSIRTPIWEKSLEETLQRFSDYPPTAMELYGKYFRRVVDLAAASGRNGLPAEAVSKVVERALIDRSPKARYIVGRGTRYSILAERLAPVWLRDWVIARRMGLYE